MSRRLCSHVPSHRALRRLRAAAAGFCLTAFAVTSPSAVAAPAQPVAAPGSADRSTEVRYGLPANPAPILRGFDEVGRYDAGHRGVDIGVAPGARALTAADGEVTVARPVAGRGVVVVEHADGIRTTYEPVDAAVSEGQRVSRGDPLGRIAGAHGQFPVDSALHWGARRGDVYVDPMALLNPLGPVRLVL